MNHPAKNISVFTWDWKEQPCWESIAQAVNDFQAKSPEKISIKYLETGSDEHCVVLYANDANVTEDLINQAYSLRYNWQDGESPEELDWDNADTRLLKMRLKYTKLGKMGLDKLKVSNSLFLRLSNGERTTELYTEIMDLS